MSKLKTKILAVANRKGGVGKSTITTLLATSLAVDKKKKVCIIDCDNQKSIASFRAMEDSNFEEEKAPYEIKALNPQFLNDFLNIYKDNYDLIFIDIPRIAENDNNTTLSILTFCDGILIPFLGGIYEVLSTNDFINAVKVLANYKNDHGIDFSFFGVLNKKSRRKENEETKEQIQNLGLSVFDNSLSNLKLFSSPSTYYSILEEKQGKERFEPFLNEFIDKFNL